MSLKAGRVGVSPDQVDEFGKISSEATGAYTKQEADAKFETQSHASSTYETKTEAAALQPKTLAVPISMLIGSQLVSKTTVEEVINTMNGGKTNEALTKEQCYDVGDEYSINLGYASGFNGYVTSSASEAVINVTLDKEIKASNASFSYSSGAQMTGRGVGGYFLNDVSLDNYNFTIGIKKPNVIAIIITAKNGDSFTATNNTPVNITFNGSISITFTQS